jgi:hypothetical protein
MKIGINALVSAVFCFIAIKRRQKWTESSNVILPQPVCYEELCFYGYVDSHYAQCRVWRYAKCHGASVRGSHLESNHYTRYITWSSLINTLARKALQKGKAQYRWPPCTNQFIFIYFWYWKYYLPLVQNKLHHEEVNCTEHSLRLVFPALARNKWGPTFEQWGQLYWLFSRWTWTWSFNEWIWNKTSLYSVVNGTATLWKMPTVVKNTKINFYLVASGGENSNQHLIVVYFLTSMLLNICDSLRQLFSCIGVYYVLSY